MSETRISRVRAGEIFADPASAALFEEYSRECSNPVIGSIAPSSGLYATCESIGIAQCFAVRVDAVLCGFAFVLTSALPHYGRKFATVESLFLAPSARSNGLGVALMDEVEAYAEEAKCEAIFYSAPVNSKLARLLFLMDGDYHHTNLIFTKRLR